MYVYGVWMHIRVFWSVQALYGATNALYWKCFKRQNSTHLTPVKHQNTKTSLYKLTKNYWVITLFEILGSVRRDLQSTVSLDHPVVPDSVLPPQHSGLLCHQLPCFCNNCNRVFTKVRFGSYPL